MGARYDWFSLSLVQVVDRSWVVMAYAMLVVMVRYKLSGASADPIRKWSFWFLLWIIMLAVVAYPFGHYAHEFFFYEFRVLNQLIIVASLWILTPLIELAVFRVRFSKARKLGYAEGLLEGMRREGASQELIRAKLTEVCPNYDKLSSWWERFENRSVSVWKTVLSLVGVAGFYMYLVSMMGRTFGFAAVLQIESEEMRDTYWAAKAVEYPEQYGHKINRRLEEEIIFTDSDRNLVRVFDGSRGWFELRESNVVLDSFVESARDVLRRLSMELDPESQKPLD